MWTSEGPFPMETTYTWTPVDPSSTRMEIAEPQAPAGKLRLVAPFMARAVRRANRRDLAAQGHPGGPASSVTPGPCARGRGDGTALLRDARAP